MFGLGKKKTTEVIVEFDPKKEKAVLKCSICNGEQVAGFKNLETGKFNEVMLIRSEKDLELFKTRYHLSEITKEY